MIRYGNSRPYCPYCDPRDCTGHCEEDRIPCTCRHAVGDDPWCFAHAPASLDELEAMVEESEVAA